MFYCVSETEIQRLAERTTSGIAAFAMERSWRNRSVLADDGASELQYDYLDALFPTADEMNEVMQSDKPKKKIIKLAKAYIKMLYTPDLDDDRCSAFNMAVNTLMHVATKAGHGIVVFVHPDEMGENKLYYRCIEIYLNAILAEFYAETAPKKGVPKMMFNHFFPGWIKASKKERKAIVKYYNSNNFDVPKKYLKKMKRKEIKKAIVKYAARFDLSASGSNLYDLINITFGFLIKSATIRSARLDKARSDFRKSMANILVARLGGHSKSDIKNLEGSVPKSKGTKKIMKKLKKRVKNLDKNYRDYYDELVAIITSDGGLNATIPEGYKTIKLPKIKKGIAADGMDNKKCNKLVKKFAKMDIGVLAAIFIHLADRTNGIEVGSAAYVKDMTYALNYTHKHGEGQALAKNFSILAKRAKKIMEASAK